MIVSGCAKVTPECTVFVLKRVSGLHLRPPIWSYKDGQRNRRNIVLVRE